MKRRFLFTAKRQRVFISTVFFCAIFSALSYGLQESTGPNGSNVQAVHALGYEGQNINIGFISQDNLRVSHEAFYEKDPNGLPTGPQHAFVHDPLGFGINESNHDTQLAGIIVSNGGENYPDQIGVTPKADLHNVRVSLGGSIYTDDLQNALIDLITVYNCKVIVTGIALPIDGDGQSLWSIIYDYYAQAYDVVFANAAGNYSSSYPDITTVNVFGDAYNGITTAGFINTDSTAVYDKVGSLSLSGQTVDGRNKPEVGAPSPNQTVPSSASDTSWTTAVGTTQGYTSWSVPHTAGVAAILLSYADTTTEPYDNQNEVIKAVIVNSTFPNIINKAGTATTGQTWDTDRGYGRIDALRAYEILSNPGITTTQPKGWAYDAASPGQQNSYTIVGIKNERLLVTTTWDRRIEWNDQNFSWQPGYGIIENGELVPHFANLDLEIYDPNGLLISPAASAIDNLEKVDLLLTKTGDYQIKIINQSGSESANYALAFEVLPPLIADFNIDYVVNDLDLVEFVPFWLDTDCNNPIQPCYPLNLSSSDSLDLSDFSIFAQQWLDYDGRYYSP